MSDQDPEKKAEEHASSTPHIEPEIVDTPDAETQTTELPSEPLASSKKPSFATPGLILLTLAIILILLLTGFRFMGGRSSSLSDMPAAKEDSKTQSAAESAAEERGLSSPDASEKKENDQLKSALTEDDRAQPAIQDQSTTQSSVTPPKAGSLVQENSAPLSGEDKAQIAPPPASPTPASSAPASPPEEIRNTDQTALPGEKTDTSSSDAQEAADLLLQKQQARAARIAAATQSIDREPVVDKSQSSELEKAEPEKVEEATPPPPSEDGASDAALKGLEIDAEALSSDVEPTSAPTSALVTTPPPDKAEKVANDPDEIKALKEALLAQNAQLKAANEEARQAMALELNKLRQELAEAQQRYQSEAVDQALLLQQKTEIERLTTLLSETENRQNKEAEQKLAALQEQVERIENQAQKDASRKIALTLSLARLADKVRQGEPFQDELAVFAELSADRYSLSQLGPFAENGIAPLTSLKAQYPPLAREALAAVRRENSHGFFGGIWVSLSNLFNARPVGNVAGDTPSAIIARAETHLAADELTESLRELDSLPPEALSVMTPWRRSVENRIRAQASINQIEAQLLQDLQ